MFIDSSYVLGWRKEKASDSFWKYSNTWTSFVFRRWGMWKLGITSVSSVSLSIYLSHVSWWHTFSLEYFYGAVLSAKFKLMILPFIFVSRYNSAKVHSYTEELLESKQTIISSLSQTLELAQPDNLIWSDTRDH